MWSDGVVVIGGCSERNMKKPWSSCPNCLLDLSPKSTENRRPYLNCPFCGAPIMPIWWMRIPVVVLSLVLSFGIPASIGFVGVTLFFLGLLCWYPSFVIAYILFFTTVPPKYMRRRENYTTPTSLFQR